MTNTVSNGISDFKLSTACGQPISDRVCCKDDIVASWVVLNPTSDCSDNSNVGYITLTGASCTNSYILKRDTSDHKFCFYSCDDIEQSEHQTLHFHRQCSDKSDNFSICLERFKTTVEAGSDQTILFGATAVLGAGEDDSHTVYCWTGENFVSDHQILNTVVRPCTPGNNHYEVYAYDSDFPECSDFDCVGITVLTPTIIWSDIQQSDGGSTCTFSATLISSDTYTNRFHVALTNTAVSSDYFSSDVDTPYYFTQTVNKPIIPGTISYKLSATLSDFADCSDATTSEFFSCAKPLVTLPGGPSTLEMLIRLFGFLFLFVFFGFVFFV